MRLRPIRIPLALSLILLLPACIPLVTHAPRVEPRFTVGMTAALATDSALAGSIDLGNGTITPVLPPFIAFARMGWTPETSGVPVPMSLGVSVPIAVPFSIAHPEADAYVQLSPAANRTLAAGAGLLVSRSYTTPYVQFGRDLEDGVILYTTQSVAFFHGGDRAPDATVWMPAAALKYAEYSVFLQAGVGRERPSAVTTRAVRFAMIGIIVEFKDRRSRASEPARTQSLPARRSRRE